jgi:hypothetical protein
MRAMAMPRAGHGQKRARFAPGLEITDLKAWTGNSDLGMARFRNVTTMGSSSA